MKLSKKLMMISVAALMGISPVVAAGNANIVSASAIHKTYGKNSKVTATKTMYFVDRNGKKTNKKAIKGGKYTIWLVTKIDGKLYYGIETDGKYWIPASATKGSVNYSVKKTTKKAAKSTKKTSKTVKKNTKKTTKKTNSAKKTKAVPSTKLVTTKRAQVYDKNGNKAKTYQGSKKWTIIGKNVKLFGHGTKTIKGEKYIALEPNRYYIKADAVKAR